MLDGGDAEAVVYIESIQVALSSNYQTVRFTIYVDLGRLLT